MIPVTLPRSTFPGNRKQDGRGLLVNCYAEPDGEDGDVRIVRDAGISLFGTSTHTNFRGFVEVPGALYAIIGNRVVQFFGNGTSSDIAGTVTGEGPVITARNNAATPDIVIVAPGDGVFLLKGGILRDYPDADIGQPNSVSIFKEFFIFTYGDGTTRSSDPGSTNINTQNFAAAEYKPDTLLRSAPAGGVLLLFGSSSIEVWGGTVNDTGYPFSFMQGIDRGLIGWRALSGYQQGFGGGIVFVGDDNGVYQFTSGAPSKISPQDLDRLIEKVADKSTIEVMTYGSRGHLIAVVQCADWSWSFDLNTQKWHIKKSYLEPRWRATQAIMAFGKWIVGDVKSGNLGFIDGSENEEYGSPLPFVIETGPQKNFPNRMRVSRIHVYLTVGVGRVTGAAPIEVSPTMEIEFSGDGGLNWTAPRQRQIGEQSIGRTSVNANEFGHATGQGARWRFTVTDPVDVSVMGAAMEARELRP